MVIFEKEHEDEEFVKYLYYPEGKKDKKPGVIIVDKMEEKISITEVAEGDWEREIPAEEMNMLVNSINETKKEDGETDFIEPATEPEYCIYYGDHAVDELCKYLRKGIVPEKGSQMWY